MFRTVAAFVVGVIIGILFGFVVGALLCRAVDLQKVCVLRVLSAKLSAWECPYTHWIADVTAFNVFELFLTSAGHVSAHLVGAALPAPVPALVD